MQCTELDHRHYDLLEVFAGVARVAQAGRFVQKRTAAVDITYDASAAKKGSMDLLTPSGFVRLSKTPRECLEGNIHNHPPFYSHIYNP